MKVFHDSQKAHCHVNFHRSEKNLAKESFGRVRFQMFCLRLSNNSTSVSGLNTYIKYELIKFRAEMHGMERRGK